MDHRGFFLIILSGHWVFGWFAYVGEQAAHQQPIEVSAYTIQMMRDTLENWQSEFLQLLWQVAGLAMPFTSARRNPRKATIVWRRRSTRSSLRSSRRRGTACSTQSSTKDGTQTRAFVREVERRTGSRAGSTL